MSPSRIGVPRALAVLAACCLLCACRSKGDPVQAALDDLFRAAGERDASAVASLLTAGFQAADGTDRDGAVALVRRYFAAYHKLSVAPSALTIERGEGAALARFEVRLSGTPANIGGLAALLPRDSRYRFEIRLVPEGSRWKAAWASWAARD